MFAKMAMFYYVIGIQTYSE